MTVSNARVVPRKKYCGRKQGDLSAPSSPRSMNNKTAERMPKRPGRRGIRLVVPPLSMATLINNYWSIDVGIYKQVRIRGEAVFRRHLVLINERNRRRERVATLSGRLNCRVIPVNRGNPRDCPITGRGGESSRPGDTRAFRARGGSELRFLFRRHR